MIFFINLIILKLDFNNWVRLEGMYFEPETIAQGNAMPDFIVLKSGSIEHLFETIQIKRSQSLYRNQQDVVGKEFLTLIPSDSIENGIFSIGFCHNQKVTYYDLLLIRQNQMLTVTSRN